LAARRGIDGDGNRTHLVQREVRQQRFRTVAHEHCNMLSLADTLLQQAVRDPVGELMRLAVVQAASVGDMAQENLFAHPFRFVLQNPGNGHIPDVIAAPAIGRLGVVVL